jgi:L-seryl-tRNA(Ser) seleniumtransferase
VAGSIPASSGSNMNESALRQLPQIEQLLKDPFISPWFDRISRQLTVNIVRSTINSYRKRLLEGEDYNVEILFQQIDNQCNSLYDQRIKPVINATGIILHTNMGRSPLPEKVWNDCKGVNVGYSNLELSLGNGKRGKRNGLLPQLISELTGAEASLIVNNNAAAILLTLTALAKNRKVIVSRGEQVQIGGGFRIPEILKLSGTGLIEVGTTNITTAEDYLNAVTEDTAIILKVHRSNFALRGFTKEPNIIEITSKLPENIITVVDQGSGVIDEDLPGETKVESYLKSGADIVTFSADKIIGGPQAGIIVGSKDLITIIEKHPLARTYRPGKTIYSLLESVLINRLTSIIPNERTQITSILSGGSDVALKKCQSIKRGLSSNYFSISQDTICVGGGSTPDEYFDSYSINIRSEKMKSKLIIEELRKAEPPVIGIIKNEKVVLNPAVLDISQLKYIKSVLKNLSEKL